MAQKNKSKTRFRVRAKAKQFKTKTRMAFGRFRRRFRRFRPFRRFRSFRRRPRYNGGGNGVRVPFVGRSGNKLILLLAMLGGIIYLFKDHIKPLMDKILHNNTPAPPNA